MTYLNTRVKYQEMQKEYRTRIGCAGTGRCEGGKLGQGGMEIEEIPAFARKRSASDGMEYAADVAEDSDLVYLIENTCLHCSKLMSKSEIKILPPSYIQQRDRYVSGGVVKKRLMCVGCYNTLRSTSREKVRFDRFKNSNSLPFIRATISRLLSGR